MKFNTRRTHVGLETERSQFRVKCRTYSFSYRIRQILVIIKFESRPHAYQKHFFDLSQHKT